MSDAINLVTILLLLLGGFFFLAGTVGLMRFPDALSRLHALSKADNIGLGFMAMGLALQAESLIAGIKILVIWVIAVLASAFTCYLVANREAQHGDHNSNL
jgi:multicomponent Na+:H+ antiporter subunit G